MSFWNALQGVASIGQSLIDRQTQKQQLNTTIKENRRLAEYQYSKDLEMWNKANEYNAPSAQMGRLKSAGLNPNLVYGGGSATTQASGNLPKYNAPTENYQIAPLNVLGMLSNWQDIEMKKQQTDAVKLANAGAKQDLVQKTYNAKFWEDWGSQMNLNRITGSNIATQHADIKRLGDMTKNKLAQGQLQYQTRMLDAQLNKILQDVMYQTERTTGQQFSNKWADPGNYGKLGTAGFNALKILRDLFR